MYVSPQRYGVAVLQKGTLIGWVVLGERQYEYTFGVPSAKAPSRAKRSSLGVLNK